MKRNVLQKQLEKIQVKFWLISHFLAIPYDIYLNIFKSAYIGEGYSRKRQPVAIAMPNLPRLLWVVRDKNGTNFICVTSPKSLSQVDLYCRGQFLKKNFAKVCQYRNSHFYVIFGCFISLQDI
jgi:hypothetical protein